MANLNTPFAIVVSRYFEGVHSLGGRRERVYTFQVTTTDTTRELAATREWLMSGAMGVGRFRCEAVDTRGIVVEHGVVGVKVRPVMPIGSAPYPSLKRKVPATGGRDRRSSGRSER